ncbi:MAG: hypothetical protein ACK5M7_04560, partial [Draconibacterium sp.]
YYAITQLITIQKTSKNQIAYKFTSGRLKQEAALLGQPLSIFSLHLPLQWKRGLLRKAPGIKATSGI